MRRLWYMSRAIASCQQTGRCGHIIPQMRLINMLCLETLENQYVVPKVLNFTFLQGILCCGGQNNSTSFISNDDVCHLLCCRGDPSPFVSPDAKRSRDLAALARRIGASGRPCWLNVRSDSQCWSRRSLPVKRRRAQARRT
jgi:hypothetical protein